MSPSKNALSELHDWRGKIALVTGASSGIGRAIAFALATHGLDVCISARRADRLEQLAEEIAAVREERRADPNAVPVGRILAVTADMRDAEEIRGLFHTVREQWGGVDVLVNNAGLGRKAALIDGDPERWREMLDVNVLALSICTQEAIKDMRARGDQGYVFHIGSLSGHRVPGPGGSMYGATKFAVRALTEGLRLELNALQSKIRVTVISPGFVETEFAQVFNDGDLERAKETYSRYKVLEPDDIAEMVVYALGTPAHMQIHDMLVRPTAQPT